MAKCKCEDSEDTTTEMRATIRRLQGRMADMMARVGMMGATTGNPCGGQPYCSPDLVAPDTAAMLKGGNRTLRSSPVIASLAAGGTVPITIPPNGLERTVVLTDLISSLTNLDALLLVVSASGVEKFTVNGGVFDRGNANTCVTACGYAVCVGPVETITINVTNQSGAAFGATDTMTLSTTSVYRGEPGFLCGECIPPGAGGFPSGEMEG